jgi:predicted RNA binding protein YcfA (HicA-like mRNA interferase family)
LFTGNTRQSREVHAALVKKGFICNQAGKHVHYIFSKKIRTMISHSNTGKTLNSFLVAKMAKQLHLTKQQFLDLIDCRLSEEGYRECLRDLGILK